jgi:trehalose-6-phosphatase
MFVGDDLTDEHAFRAIKARGVGILVREPADPDRRTAADYAVAGTNGVRRLLEWFTRQVRESRS